VRRNADVAKLVQVHDLIQFLFTAVPGVTPEQ
jgi:hypothetical protein